jgi:hypothetical protein
MSARVLEGGGWLGEASLDNAQSNNAVSSQKDDDIVGAMVRLQTAGEEYRCAQDDEHRRRCVIEGVRSLGCIFPHTKWADDLACQLEGLEWGRAGAMLTRNPYDRRGKPPRDIQVTVLRAFGCAYMSMLMEAGLSVREADAAVKKKMKLRWRSVGVQLSPTMLISWRRQLRSKKHQGTVDAKIYWSHLKRPDSRRQRTLREIEVWVATWINESF